MDNSPLGALPKEIRDQIAEYVLSFDFRLVLSHSYDGGLFDPDEDSELLRLSSDPQNWYPRAGSSYLDEDGLFQIRCRLLDGWPSVCRQARIESGSLLFSLNAFDFECSPTEDAYDYDATVYAEKGLKNLHLTFGHFGTLNVAAIREVRIDLGQWHDFRQSRSIVDKIWAGLWAVKDRIHPTAEISVHLAMYDPSDDLLHISFKLKDEASVQRELYQQTDRSHFDSDFVVNAEPGEVEEFEKSLRDFVRGTKISEEFVQQALGASIESD